MGQNSSQVASTQIPHPTDAPPSSHESYFAPKSPPANMTEQKRARSVVHDEDAMLPQAKKAKTNAGHDAKTKRKAGRSMPQHCRGTAIMPSQETDVSKPLLHTQVAEPAEPTAASPSFKPYTYHDSRSQSDKDQSAPIRTKKKHDKGSKKTKNAEAVHNDNDEDGATVNPIGKPGPRKGKKAKSTQQGLQHGEATQPVQHQLSLPPAETSTANDPASKHADEPAQTETTRKKKRPRTVPAPNNVDSTTASNDQLIATNEQPQLEQNAHGGDKEPKPRSKGAKQPQQQKHGLGTALGSEELANPRPIEEASTTRNLSKKSKSKAQKRKATEDTAAPKPNEIQQVPSTGKHKQNPTGNSTKRDAIGPSQVPSNDSSTVTSTTTSTSTAPSPPPKATDTVNGAKDDEYEDEGESDAPTTDSIRSSDPISAWLHSKQSPAPPEEPALSPSSSRKVGKPTPVRKPAVTKINGGDTGDENPSKESQLLRPSSGQTIETRGIVHGAVQGAWSAEEKALADTIFTSCFKEANMTAYELKCQIVDWRKVGLFRWEMTEAFSYREKSSVRKFCQRRYQPYSTGAWTPEEDDILKEKVAEFGKSWANVCAFVDRPPAACRDRWKNIVQYDTTMETGPWTVQQENELATAVKDLLATLEQQCQDEGVKNDPERLEMMIDWNAIAQVLGGRRSAKRCLAKWKTLKQRAQISGDPGLQESAANTQQSTSSKKQQRLDSAYSSLGWADVYDALMEICYATAAEPDRMYEHETTFWSVMSAANPQSDFPPKLRRRCYYESLEKFGSSDKKVSRAVGIGSKAKLLKGIMWKLKQAGQISWESNPPKPKIKKESATKHEENGMKENYMGLEAEMESRVEQRRSSQPRSPATVSGHGVYASRVNGRKAVRGKGSFLSKDRIENSDEE